MVNEHRPIEPAILLDDRKETSEPLPPGVSPKLQPRAVQRPLGQRVPSIRTRGAS